ncbi:MAG: right-handed parallel beta-helix repeat-containing protein [Sedimentisphaerales bacterium]|nr:right-handed parallel beta-helix repeat-containing protein [Sedimentisphaerales bacterium]
MIRSFTSRFWIIVVITACANVCLASNEKIPSWSNTYSDDFQTNKAESDSYYHSIFWPQNAFPPSEPYLFYKDNGQNIALGFRDYNRQWANLVYCLPFEQRQRTISGQLRVDMAYLTDSGKLRYSLSSDGKNWSDYKDLFSGANVISLKSIRGICYIKFSGYDVMIDNLKVDLFSYPADYFVESGASYPKFATIQDAIDSAASDTGIDDEIVIEVAPGTYSGNGNHDIEFIRGREITLYSEKGPELTTIICEEGQRGFYFYQNEDSNSIVRGFTIKNGKKTNSNGGGIYCEYSSPSIIDCIIKDCSAKYGAGICSVDASPLISDCIIQNCKSDLSGGYGPGIALLEDSNAIIVNTIIQNNTGYNNSYGGGLYCSQSRVILANCEIRNNTKSSTGNLTGGGIYATGAASDIELQNCIIADNNAQSGAGMYTDSKTVEFINDAQLGQIAIACKLRLNNCTVANNTGDGIYSVKSDTFINNSIIWGNSGHNVWIDDSVYAGIILSSDIQDVNDDLYNKFIGQDIKSVDPLFSPIEGDYHLKSHVGRFNPLTQTWVIDDVNSPCIDAGAQSDSVGPEPCPNGKRINIGAYGGTEQASKNYSPKIIHVATSVTTGNNSHKGTSRDDAFAKIQDAVNNARNGDYILIWSGIYYEDVFITGKSVTIQSADEPAEIRAVQGYAFSYYYAESSDSVLRNLIITNCNDSYGGAIFMQYASPQLINLTIAYNIFGIVNSEGASHPIITNCIFWNNWNGNKSTDMEDSDKEYTTYSRMEYVQSLTTNINDDPGFFVADRDNGDYHLKSVNGRYRGSQWERDTVNSPCIDKGNPSIGPVLEPWPNNGWRINMGAYGGTPFASKSSQ